MRSPAAHGPSAPDAVIAYVGNHQFAPGEKISQPKVQSRLLLWCKAGKGSIRVNGTRLPLEPDDFCFLPWDRSLVYLPDDREPFLTGSIHLIPFHDRSRPVVFWVPHNPKDPMADCAWRSDLPLGALDGVRRGSMKQAVPLHYLAEYIVRRFHEREGTEWEARSLAQSLLAELHASAHASRPGNPELPLALTQMIEYIDHHKEIKICVKDLAPIAGLTVSSIGRMFRRHLGMTPVAFIHRDKIAHAKFHLARSSKPVAEIGRMSGIDDPYYFSKLFKKTTGLTPLEYRKKSSFL
ncbi:MAG: AraC family transcriptional regulator [Terrimicrobiaceae bacterium]